MGFARVDNMETILTFPQSKTLASLSWELDKKLKQTQKAITILDRYKRMIIETMNKNYSEKPKSAYVQVQLFMKENVKEKFQQVVFVN